MSDKNNERYTATLVFYQDGLDGDVMSSLRFDPLINKDDIGDDGLVDVPMAYGVASVAAEAALTAMGILDDDGNIVQEDELHNVVNIDASKPSKLN